LDLLRKGLDVFVHSFELTLAGVHRKTLAGNSLIFLVS
jgi:hypothetical protein